MNRKKKDLNISTFVVVFIYSRFTIDTPIRNTQHHHHHRQYHQQKPLLHYLNIYRWTLKFVQNQFQLIVIIIIGISLGIKNLTYCWDFQPNRTHFIPLWYEYWFVYMQFYQAGKRRRRQACLISFLFHFRILFFLWKSRNESLNNKQQRGAAINYARFITSSTKTKAIFVYMCCTFRTLLQPASQYVRNAFFCLLLLYIFFHSLFFYRIY